MKNSTHQKKFKLFEIVDKFLDETNMQWNHHDWLNLLSKIERAGYIINPDELGKLLERERERRIKEKEHKK